MPDLTDLSFEDYDKQVKDLKGICEALQITSDEGFEQSKRESQAYSACRLEILKLADGLEYAIKITNQKLDAYYRKPKPAPQKVTVSVKQEAVKPKPSLFDDFDTEPLSKDDAMALEMKKSLDSLF
jgi:hypothetical protein